MPSLRPSSMAAGPHFSHNPSRFWLRSMSLSSWQQFSGAPHAICNPGASRQQKRSLAFPSSDHPCDTGPRGNTLRCFPFILVQAGACSGRLRPPPPRAGDAVLKSATKHAISLVRGHRLGEAFRAQPEFRTPLRSIEIGEHTGRLEEESTRAAEFFKDKTLQALDAFAQWAPRLLYILILCLIGWRIIAIAFDISNQISSALNIET